VNSIEAIQVEVEYQLQDLSRLDLPSINKNCLFVGAGDSYAASLAAQHISESRALSCYPTDVILNPSLVRGRNVYIVSISGATKANVLTAMVAMKQGVRTTAITAEHASKLANLCDGLIELRYRRVGVATAGTISFTCSMLTCAALAAKIQAPRNIDFIYSQAQRQAGEAANKIVRRKGNYFILGNGLLHSVAHYSALKFIEILGEMAVPYPVEEFCHSPLFSLRKADHVIIMATENDGRNLDKRLRQEGFSSIYINFESKGIELLLHSTFFMQLLVLELARVRRMTDCYFLKNKRLLKVSSDFIYD